MDPQDPRTVYATVAGYGRRWAFPGAVGKDTSRIGRGHVFKSTDAGASFRDVSGDLPDTPANWSVLHNGHLVVGTGPTFGGAFARPLAVAFRLRERGTVTVTFAQRGRTLLRRSFTITSARYTRVRLPAAKARPGDVRVILAAAGSLRQTVRLTGRRLPSR